MRDIKKGFIFASNETTKQLKTITMGAIKNLLLGSRPQQLDRESMLEAQINAQYDEFCSYVAEWECGNRTPENATISEFEYLNKPSKK